MSDEIRRRLKLDTILNKDVVVEVTPSEYAKVRKGLNRLLNTSDRGKRGKRRGARFPKKS